MKYEIMPDGRLKLTVTKEEQAALRIEMAELKDEPGRTGEMQESDWLEPLLCNSELEWIPDGVCMGDLTSAPMLGILGEEGYAGLTKLPASFGVMECGHTGAHAIVRPVLQRWAWMDYAVRSFLDDLADNGECIWEGGAAQ